MNTALLSAFNLRALALFTVYLTLMFSLSAQAAPGKIANTGKINGQPGSVADTPPDMTYFALEGDTLSGIAKRFTEKSSNWVSIGKRNQIINDRTIPVGSAILIPMELLPEEASKATVIALAGQSSAKKKNGVDTAIALGDVLTEGTQISTGKNGFLSLELPDESRISIPSNSQVLLAKLKMSKYTKSPLTEIRLQQGRVESKVSPLVSNKGRFEVSSPLAIAGVRGTHFRVGINDDGDGVANEVLSGRVAVGKKEHPNALVLNAGQGNIITRAGVGSAIELLPAPVLEDGYQLQENPTIQFVITKIDKAVSYRAQISTDPNARNVLIEGRIGSGHFKIDGLLDGNYYIRITAFDATGLEGRPSLLPFTLKARPQPPLAREPKEKSMADAVNFAWSEANGASSYRLQVAHDAEFKHRVIDQTEIAATEYSAGALATGNYFWRVASITKKDGKNDQGPFGETQTLQVLPPDSKAQLNEHLDHLQALDWLPASDPLFLK